MRHFLYELLVFISPGWVGVLCGCVGCAIQGNSEILSWIEAGNRLSKPPACPAFLYDVCLRCWQSKPSDRPSAEEVVLQLAQHLNVAPPKGRTPSESNPLLDSRHGNGVVDGADDISHISANTQRSVVHCTALQCTTDTTLYISAT